MKSYKKSNKKSYKNIKKKLTKKIKKKVKGGKFNENPMYSLANNTINPGNPGYELANNTVNEVNHGYELANNIENRGYELATPSNENSNHRSRQTRTVVERSNNGPFNVPKFKN